MKRLIASATIVFLATNGYVDELEPFTITGELINIGSDLKVIDRSEADQTTEEKSAVVFQTPSVVISHTDAKNDGTLKNVEIASGSFENGRITLEALIDQPIDVLVSVVGLGDRPLTLKTNPTPGESLSFVVLDYASERYNDELLLVGNSELSVESKAKFTISGDLSSITDKDLSVAIVEVRSKSGKALEGSTVATSNSIFLDNGTFLFEGIVKEPVVVYVSVRTPDYTYWGVVDAVVEPGARIKISPSTTSSSFHQNRASDLMAISETNGSMHTKVIESWQNSDKYLAKLDEYATTIKSEQQKAATESEEETAEGQEETSDTTEDTIPDSYDIFQEMETIKNSVLSPTVMSMKDPMVALLAMEIGVPESRQLEMWDKLANVLDEDIVARRVLPRRNARAKQIELAGNASSIVEGQIAPEFTLANLEGEEVALSDVLAENEFVLVDFWASWCGPCIVTIPKLKELHSEYKDDGFEIVFVSIDEEFDDWKGESERQELPWVNVGDLNGWLAQTAVDYGVQWIPTEFALDSEGKIFDREVSPEELESLLADRFRSEEQTEETDKSSTDGDVNSQ
ncbi:MAG: TlpA family protein disulfide reductase [Gammaproteobacteria bacterium]|nr:TlpA family protein disulfide reductase [Gammaproteobacteria bacterium]MYD81426.1 TlpA family protein disulfide reductase [Gammaproteobacteria bacterium]